ncbi:MAG: glycosyltransferase [Ornithinibacter sp.]
MHTTLESHRPQPSTRRRRLQCELVMPLRWDSASPEDEAELAAYLDQVAAWCDVTVVDGSPAPQAAARRAGWPEQVRVLDPDPRWSGANGKVTGAMTGIAAARHPFVVVCDDDVRYGRAELSTVVTALRVADLVVPQNVPTRWPWWVWWESGRMLLNRAVAVDWPGTVGCRRDTVLRAGGWSPDVLFENLEMARTVEAAGGVVVHRPDVLVPRRPPRASHFLRQRVRQAYEDAASPVRWMLGLGTVPALLLLCRRASLLGAVAAGVVAVAEVGRRRSGGRRAFPPWASLAAPLWAIERGICSWVALGARIRGGARYNGRRLPVAAHSERDLRRRLAARSAALTPELTETDHFTEGNTMNIDKDEIVELLRSRGQHDVADHAERELPVNVDTDQHGAKLDQLGINPAELLSGIGGTFG